MTKAIEFIAASIALLATPGPTNTLLATSSASVGFRRSLRLLPAELAGYGVSIALLTIVVGPIVATQPIVGRALRGMCAGLLGLVAWRLWRKASPNSPKVAPIRARDVFGTTLINPKAIVFAFAILPPMRSGHRAELAPFAVVLALLIVGIGTAWLAFGAAFRATAGRSVEPAWIRRGGAVVIAGLAIVLAGSAMRRG